MRVFFEEVTENGGKKTNIIGKYARTQIHVWSINIGVDFNNSCLARFEPDLCDTIYELQMYMYIYSCYTEYRMNIILSRKKHNKIVSTLISITINKQKYIKF